MSSIEEIVAKKIDEIFTDEKIKSIVRHEVEERIGKLIWELEDYIKETLIKKVPQMICTEHIEEEIRERVSPEKIGELIEEKMKGRWFEELVESEIREAFKKIEMETFKDKVVEAALNTAREYAKQITSEKLKEIFEARINASFSFIINSIEETRRVVMDLMQRVSRLEMRGHD
jgi:uncharacterized membrane protein YheB (UPF0754 family)